MGKLIITLNPDTLGSDDLSTSSRAAYRIWSGLIVQNGRAISVDFVVPGPILEDYWDGYTGASSTTSIFKEKHGNAEILMDNWSNLIGG